MTPADPPVGAVTTQMPRAFSSDPARADGRQEADPAVLLIRVVHGALVDGPRFDLQLDRTRQTPSGAASPDFTIATIAPGDLVDEGVHLRLTLAGDWTSHSPE